MSITLEKAGDYHKIGLSQNIAVQQLIVKVRLNQSKKYSRSLGLFSKLMGNKAPQIDLGCMYETIDGKKGVIQSCDGNFGAISKAPYIFLDKDDRAKAAKNSENVTIYRLEMIKQVIFFLICQSAEHFQSVDNQMTFQINNGEQIHIQLNNSERTLGNSYNGRKGLPASDPHNMRSGIPWDALPRNFPLCATAMIKNIDSQVNIVKEEKYFPRHNLADDYYQFGF
jgi:tellurite resistance protein TerA